MITFCGSFTGYYLRQEAVDAIQYFLYGSGRRFIWRCRGNIRLHQVNNCSYLYLHLLTTLRSVISPSLDVWHRLAARREKLSLLMPSFNFVAIYYILIVLSSLFHAIAVLSNSFITEVSAKCFSSTFIIMPKSTYVIYMFKHWILP